MPKQRNIVNGKKVKYVSILTASSEKEKGTGEKLHTVFMYEIDRFFVDEDEIMHIELLPDKPVGSKMLKSRIVNQAFYKDSMERK